MQLEPAVLRTMMSTERFTVDLPMTPVSIHCVPDDWMYSTKKSKLVVVVALAIIAAKHITPHASFLTMFILPLLFG